MKFNHGIDNEKARQYLKDIGMYDQIIKSAKENVFKGTYPIKDDFLMVIAANDEFEKRNKLKQLH